nr:MAG TPA: hypothetical protein [Caudoviricetes sp.]DAS33609.1 MAG TPA: hypothetical protein [Caudoviricetes sp.]
MALVRHCHREDVNMVCKKRTIYREPVRIKSIWKR